MINGDERDLNQNERTYAEEEGWMVKVRERDRAIEAEVRVM